MNDTKEMEERINKIIKYLNTDIHEREEVIAVSLLAALAGQNIFYSALLVLPRV